MESVRRHEWQQLTSLFLGATLVRLLLGWIVNGPTIFTDEYQYVEMARSFHFGKGLAWDNLPVNFPCWLYPMLIAAPLKLLSWNWAYAVIRFMNAVLMAATLFPVYGLARELAGHRRALAAAALVALLPAGGYSALIMTESMFFPAVMLAMWAIYRAVLTPTAWRRLAAGLACGMAFHVKPQGILLPSILAAVVLIFEADRLRDAGGGGGLRRYALGAGAHWLTALGWLIAFLPRVLAVKFIEQPGAPLTLKNILGFYTGIAEGLKSYSALDVAASFVRYGAAWVWCAGLIPVWVLGRRLLGCLKKQEAPPVRLLVILTIAATGAMLGLVARHTLAVNPTWLLHERYFFVILPLVLILFAVTARAEASPCLSRWPWDFLILAIILLHVWMAQIGPWYLSSISPSFTGLLLFLKSREVGLALVILYLLPIIAALALLLLKPVLHFRSQCLIAGLMFVGFNISWYGYQGSFLNGEREPDLALARKIEHDRGKPGGRMIILSDGLTRETKWQIGIRNHGAGLSLAGGAREWWEEPLELDREGCIAPPASPAHAWFLASNIWKMNRAPEKSYTNCALYRLDGKRPLCLDAGQVALAQRNAVATGTLEQCDVFLSGVRISYLEKRVPAEWVAGRSSRIVMTIRNDSPFAFPGGAYHMCMGYHWSDHERTHDWNAVVWDDGNQAPLPDWMEPGQSHEIVLDVMAPTPPSDTYVLETSPVVVVGTGGGNVRKWSLDAKNKVLARLKVRPAGAGAPATAMAGSPSK